MAVIVILIILISLLVIFGSGRIGLAYAESRRAKALSERAVIEMRLRVALEEQLAEERGKRIKLERELSEMQKDYEEAGEKERFT